MKSLNICVIAPDYPDSKRPTNTFIKNLVDQWGIMGQELTVIAPYSITKTRKITTPKEIKTSYPIDIRRPKILTLSNIRIAGRAISREIVLRSVDKELNKLKKKPDVIYCHFWEQSFGAYKYAMRENIPIIVASGESVIPTEWAKEQYRSMCNAVSHVICVSTKNMKESVELGLTTEEKCTILPNGIDNTLFRITDETELKKTLGIQDGDFVIAFVGWFINRKGANRISEAIDKLNDSSIKSIFIGKGDVGPTCKGVLFDGPLLHDEIPRYLNCADVFVLPTLKEGCCNAIVEAMACGLPVISSDREFNYDILNRRNSIMINPESVDEIAEAILKIKNDANLRKLMSEHATSDAENLSISRRAGNILNIFYNLKNEISYNNI